MPHNFDYKQSQKQAFYFIKDIKINNSIVNNNDWIIAYHNDVIVGARKWFGEYSDVPAMGDDGFYETSGYCDDNSILNFKLFKASTLELIDLAGNIPEWSNSSNFIIYELHEKGMFPEEYKINNPYPNPFNPVVNLDFEIPMDSHVNISIYDIQGRLVENLSNNQSFERGYHTITWNAENYSSGIYFIRFNGNNIKDTKKIHYLSNSK